MTRKQGFLVSVSEHGDCFYSVNLITLLEDTVEGSCVGAGIRNPHGSTYIGSAYCPKDADGETNEVASIYGAVPQNEVETILDIECRSEVR